MCRYAFSRYKTHYACFECRRTSKHPIEAAKGWAPPCPFCGRPMVDVGRDFAAPRREATNQWRKLRLLANAGLLFHSCGCTGPGWRPRTLAEAKRL